MTQATLWQNPETFILSRLEVFNWGGFGNLHHADIDPAGTAVIGPTGSGKTTLIDALMTLLCANPRYNLASTGGHESDRDLVSYVRGISGPGDGGPGQSHIARPGKTVTGIAASLQCGERLVRLGVLLWFEGVSSSAADLKKLWLFSESPQQTLSSWLSLQQEGGMRALRQMTKDSTGIWSYPSKTAYLARLRDYFEVSENAFTLLNRAAGLKQLNSIDEIFRELVLDDQSAFERAAEVANGFDDLTEIHRELEIARKQQRSLQPVADGWQRYLNQQQQHRQLQQIDALLPVWFAEQGYRLWQTESARLQELQVQARQQETDCQTSLQAQRSRVDQLRQQYLQTGGADIDQLKERIQEWQRHRGRRAVQAGQYQQLAQNLQLADELSAERLQASQQQAAERLQALQPELEEAERQTFQAGAQVHELETQLKDLQDELAEVQRRPGSNLPPQFQQFRSQLAAELGLDEQALPFVAELVQVKPEEAAWRGAIERAIGSQRLCIMVPPESTDAALRWVNQRHNQLHVRLLNAREPAEQPRFMADGFTHKLSYKPHPYREALKALLAGIDRHCVASPQQLRHTPHAMTAQGLMSGKADFFEKQDQKRLDADWMTGFDNSDRLAQLKAQISQQQQQLAEAALPLRQARAFHASLQGRQQAWQTLQQIQFEDIDLPAAERKLDELQQQLELLIRPDSDTARLKAALEQAQAGQQRLEATLKEAIAHSARSEQAVQQAQQAMQKARQRLGSGLSDEQRRLGAQHLPVIPPDALDNLADSEASHSRQLRQQLDASNERLHGLREALVKRMSDAKRDDTGALAEVGRELEDIPHYLQRLQLLTEEALPEKLKRFLDYLNRSSDDGVTQLLSYIDHQVLQIEERLEDLNNTMREVDFQPGRYLRLVASRVGHQSITELQRAQRELNKARFDEDDGENQYRVLKALIALLRDACERNRTLASRALLDPRFRLTFSVSVIERSTGEVIETRTGSQGGSGGEKEIIASYVLTASLSYALCPAGRNRPLFGTIVLDEAFSRSSHAVAGRIIAALQEFGLHALFITPNKEMRLLRHHTRSAIIVQRRGTSSSLLSLSWQALDELHQQHRPA